MEGQGSELPCQQESSRVELVGNIVRNLEDSKWDGDPWDADNLGFDVPNHPLPTNWWGFASLKAPVGFPRQQINHVRGLGSLHDGVSCAWDCCSSSLTSPQSIQILLWQSSVMGVSPW